MLWEGRNPTILTALSWLSQMLCVLDSAVLMRMEKRRPGWLAWIARLPEISYEALAAVLRTYVNGNPVRDLGLCGAIIRDMAAFGRMVGPNTELAAALSSLLDSDPGLDDDSQKNIKAMLRQDR
jgi:hypothetical protein